MVIRNTEGLSAATVYAEKATSFARFFESYDKLKAEFDQALADYGTLKLRQIIDRLITLAERIFFENNDCLQSLACYRNRLNKGCESIGDFPDEYFFRNLFSIVSGLIFDWRTLIDKSIQDNENPLLVDGIAVANAAQLQRVMSDDPSFEGGQRPRVELLDTENELLRLLHREPRRVFNYLEYYKDEPWCNEKFLFSILSNNPDLIDRFLSVMFRYRDINSIPAITPDLINFVVKSGITRVVKNFLKRAPVSNALCFSTWGDGATPDDEGGDPSEDGGFFFPPDDEDVNS